ncbi:DUF1127 domain-containing protein [Jannaschia rubra]|uniref:DUF1127 domain-containing protein n=1 Tax=Jannaschia rubra TaxID=282197 RepID=UPI00249345C5|nr:DUF1127 domain-containing protein [Jannaschia rubra]
MHPLIIARVLDAPQRRIDIAPGRVGLRRWLRTRLDGWQRQRMVATLHSLDDRTLRDIGLHRGGIAEFVDRLDRGELRMAPVARPTSPAPEQAEVYARAA